MRSTSTLDLERHGTGPPVVLVHGAAPPHTWGELPGMLARDHEVVVYTRRGFLPTDHDMASSLRAHTDDLANVVDAVGPATVVGWSSGGVIALDLAVQRPELVRGAVVIEPPLHAKRHPTVGQLMAIAGAILRSRWSPEAGARRFLDWALARRDGRPSDLTRLDPDALSAVSPAIVNEITHATGEREIGSQALRALQPPTVWLVGACSATGASRLANRASKASSVIEIRRVSGAGHAIALDAPAAVVDAVERVESAEAS